MEVLVQHPLTMVRLSADMGLDSLLFLIWLVHIYFLSLFHLLHLLFATLNLIAPHFAAESIVHFVAVVN